MSEWEDRGTNCPSNERLDYPEQNTQRPSLNAFGAPDELTKDEEAALMNMQILTPEEKAALQAPQTEAGDVEKLKTSELKLRDFLKHASWHMDEGELESLQFILDYVAPLTQRIAELEKENERQSERAKVNADLWHKAEARVKELEQRLAGTLKVTTESTIDFMKNK